MILVSACLCGINCKYNGGNNFNEYIYNLLKQGKLIPVCPEQLGGLPTPRLPSEIVKGDAKDVLEGRGLVLNIQGEDVTKFFVKGAYETLNIARAFNCKAAILKSKSPSCGKGFVYDGTFSNKLKMGNGITAQLLLMNGVEVVDEDVVAIKKLLERMV
ncbi:Uncharacterized conserved protein YbbK, DUF523 family [Caloramator fervidus]|uniref:Uncharacterized conserved protein YbbK, DUF523 family n=1 Tax=Caloramator fervidus TaxID=29344 RepID=A0A1H5U5V2_9CLOT|nr:DUF523 domain-containing protein [Caloramator fervidus]SEF70485.1 Uncharacterized conserved protein YbbK, DUF523 family [Caloramator fervidus]